MHNSKNSTCIKYIYKLFNNGVYRANKWVAECKKAKQNLSFAGVNTHYTNGLSEKRIRDLQDQAKTMLIHANHRWPKCISTNLWPYARRMANDAMNNAPSLQNKARKTPTTGLISPQFHIAFDQSFSTTKQDYFDSLWQTKAVKEKIITKAIARILANRNVQTAETRKEDLQPSEGANKRAHDQIDQPLDRETTQSEGANNNKTLTGTPEIHTKHVQTLQRVGNANPLPERAPKINTDNKIGMTIPNDINSRANLTSNSSQSHLIEAMHTEILACTSQGIPGETFCLEAIYPESNLEAMEMADQDPFLAYKASADLDTLYLHLMMKAPDRDKLLLAKQKEVNGQMKHHGNFILMLRSDVPLGEIILPAVWQLHANSEGNSNTRSKQ